MQRSNVVLPEFTKLMWVSEAARSVWEPRLQATSLYIMERERETVKKGRCAIQSINPEALQELTQWAFSAGAALMVLYLEPLGSVYRSLPVPYEKGPFNIRIAITPLALAQPFMQAWRDSDNGKIGALLGYPDCCRAAFQKIWVDERFLDNSWNWAYHLGGQDDAIEVGGYPECNILLRWMGPRAVPHLPCSPTCMMTKWSADEFNDKSRDEYKWIMEMLSWPVEWSALHGIARIKTPIMEICSRTDFTDKLYRVRRRGTSYPAEGARGLVFPFRSGPEQDARTWNENGFASKTAMEEGHARVLAALPADIHPKSIWDLGCGNGLLLKRVGEKLGVKELIGVDRLEYDHRYQGVFYQGDISAFGPLASDAPALALISENRFIENPGLTLGGYRYIIKYSYEKMTAIYMEAV